MTSLNWQIFALGSAVFAALTAIFGKIGVSEMNSNLATLIRTIIIIAMTALILSIRGEWQKPENLSFRGISFLVASGLCTGFSWLCYYRALQLGEASKVAPIDKLSVVFVLAFSFLFLGEAFSIKTLVGGLLISIGAVVLVL